MPPIFSAEMEFEGSQIVASRVEALNVKLKLLFEGARNGPWGRHTQVPAACSITRRRQRIIIWHREQKNEEEETDNYFVAEEEEEEEAIIYIILIVSLRLSIFTPMPGEYSKV